MPERTSTAAAAPVAPAQTTAAAAAAAHSAPTASVSSAAAPLRPSAAAPPAMSLYRRAQQTFHGLSMRHTLLAVWAVGTVVIYSAVGSLAREPSVTPEQLRAHEQQMEQFRRQHTQQQKQTTQTKPQ